MTGGQRYTSDLMSLVRYALTGIVRVATRKPEFQNSEECRIDSEDSVHVLFLRHNVEVNRVRTENDPLATDCFEHSGSTVCYVTRFPIRLRHTEFMCHPVFGILKRRCVCHCLGVFKDRVVCDRCAIVHA